MQAFYSTKLASPEATAALARTTAQALRKGDVLCLEGPVGAGKSHFARHAILSLLAQPEDIPSPTFTLVQTYDTIPEIWHCDLYRMSDPHEAIELGLEEAFETAACLIEWPSRLGDLLPGTAVTLTLDPLKHSEERLARFHGAPSDLRTRLEKALA